MPRKYLSGSPGASDRRTPLRRGADDFRLPARFAPAQGPRDDASIVPYDAWGRALPDFAGHSLRKAAMHPSVGFAASSPCRGAYGAIKPPLQGEVDAPQAQTEGCGALPRKYLSGSPGASDRRTPLRRGADDFRLPARFAPAQGPGDDASIVPYAARINALPDFAGHSLRKAAMHPSVGFAATSPCRGAYGAAAAHKASPARGGGCAAGADGGVRRLAPQISFRVAGGVRPPHAGGCCPKIQQKPAPGRRVPCRGRGCVCFWVRGVFPARSGAY